MPRPVKMSPLSIDLGEVRGFHPYFSAAALIVAIDRARLKPLSSAVLAARDFSRNSMGSALAAMASSSMNDSDANAT